MSIAAKHQRLHRIVNTAQVDHQLVVPWKIHAVPTCGGCCLRRRHVTDWPEKKWKKRLFTRATTHINWPYWKVSDSYFSKLPSLFDGQAMVSHICVKQKHVKICFRDNFVTSDQSGSDNNTHTHTHMRVVTRHINTHTSSSPMKVNSSPPQKKCTSLGDVEVFFELIECFPMQNIRSSVGI